MIDVLGGDYTAVMATRNWQIAFDNLLLFGCGFVLLSLLTGLLLAILLATVGGFAHV